MAAVMSSGMGRLRASQVWPSLNSKRLAQITASHRMRPTPTTSTATARATFSGATQRRRRHLADERLRSCRRQPGASARCPPPGRSSGQRDFNGDGKRLALARQRSGKVAIWLMNGLQVSQSGSLGSVPTNWTIVGTGDFNGDGKATFCGATAPPATVAIWLMNGLQVLQSGSLGNVPTNWTIVGTGDFNGDGKTDILWREHQRRRGDLADERTAGPQSARPRHGADQLVDRRHRRLQRRRQERHSLARHTAATWRSG